MSKVRKFQRDLQSFSKMIGTTMNPNVDLLFKDTNLYFLDISDFQKGRFKKVHSA